MRDYAVFIIIGIMCGSYTSMAAEKFSYKNYNEAITAPFFLKFFVKSTKAGIITTTVDGVVKEFNIDTQVFRSSEKTTINKAHVSFSVSSMDTDNSSRDDKLQNYCLEKDNFPQIQVTIKKPFVQLALMKEESIGGLLMIRGKSFPLELKVHFEVVDSRPVIVGNAQFKISEVGVPDPSIWIARVHDEVQISFKLPY